MNLCVIPARGGSKRIPRKNIKIFNDKPIIAYSIEAAINSKCFDRVIVSTDDNEIAEVAKKFGAEVPFIRPKELSNDYTPTTPVIKHAIEWVAKNDIMPDFVLALYATAPFIDAEAICDSLQQLKDSKLEYCFSVTSFPFPIKRAIKINAKASVEMFYPEHFLTRSQDLEEAYHDAGQFYWGKTQAFIDDCQIFSELASPFLLARHKVQDIDTPDDWLRAELMYKVLSQLQKNI
jgi:pseudaminic acid cytidylyltransferase